MLVDCHTHLVREKPAGGAANAQTCDKSVYSIVLAHCEGQGDCAGANRALAEAISDRDDRIGFAVVNPMADSEEDALVRLRDEMGFAGIVLYCADWNLHPAHSRAMRLYESARELSMPVFFHNSQWSAGSVMEFSQPMLLDEVARNFPDLKIIIGSMGRPFFDQTISLAGKHENVYADLTINPRKVWTLYNLIVSAYEADVMDKLLFGSGFPAGTIDACMETLLGFNRMIANTHLPIVPREKIREIIERDTLEVLAISGFKGSGCGKGDDDAGDA